MHTIKEISEVIGGDILSMPDPDANIKHLLLDSRKIHAPKESLFFAMPGNRLDGHHFLDDVYAAHCRNFIVSKEVDFRDFKRANIIRVDSTLKALQKLAAWHRKQFNYPVIGITGSNGKTIVKEWLYQMLQSTFAIVRSPKSYNSQTGVPLSVWQMKSEHTLGIFEAGISEPDEMDKLESIIRPNIGIFTNIGEAHSEGFLNTLHKVREKLKLFVHSDVIIYCKDYPDINLAVAQIKSQLSTAPNGNHKFNTFSWSSGTEADLRILKSEKNTQSTSIELEYQEETLRFKLPFTDRASMENAMHCIATLLYLKIDVNLIQEKLGTLSKISMRLESKTGIHNTQIINDSYSNDINSLIIALDFLLQQGQHTAKTLILSDIQQSGRTEIDLYTDVAKLIQERKINRLFAIGPAVYRNRLRFESIEGLQTLFFPITQDFVSQIDTDLFQNEDILIKGARSFHFERISRLLEEKAHDTVLEISLPAIQHNLTAFQSALKPNVKAMVMVKAFAYGAGAFEIAKLLQHHRVHYLGVAYADEGVELRKAGITMPILVMNSDRGSFESILLNHLEPEIFSINQLQTFLKILREVLPEQQNQLYPIHIKLDTGMKRLGFEEDDIQALCEMIVSSNAVRVASIFSHLSASDEPQHDAFTNSQITRFEEMSQTIIKKLDYPIDRHILNTSGIARFPNAQFEMVRLGLGLYGIESSKVFENKLKHVGTLKTRIAQIKKVQPGESVGYSRSFVANKPTIIATVGVGYADGYDRRFSNGKGFMLINGKKAPVVGKVCMDMTMIDVSELDVAEGQEVIVFGSDLPVSKLAEIAGIIPYEILTGISSRVKRVYFDD